MRTNSVKFARGQVWTARRKIQLMRDIRAGTTSVEQARRDFGVTEDELNSWKGHYENFGFDGLKTTKTREFRNDRPR